MGGVGRSCLFSQREKIEMRGRLVTTTGHRRPPPSRSVTPATQRSPTGQDRGEGPPHHPPKPLEARHHAARPPPTPSGLRSFPLPRAALPPTLAPTYELRLTHGTDRYVAPIEILGFTAAALGAGALYPQVRQSWRTRSTGDLNLRALLTIAVSIVLFVSYGIAIGSPSVITANIVAGVMILSLAYLKIRHG